MRQRPHQHVSAKYTSPTNSGRQEALWLPSHHDISTIASLFLASTAIIPIDHTKKCTMSDNRYDLGNPPPLAATSDNLARKTARRDNGKKKMGIFLSRQLLLHDTASLLI
jgi:hypothetical protein